MELKRLLVVIMGVALTAALLPAFMSVSDADFALQSPQPTHTYTPVPRGPTDTPVPPTPTDTPPPPTPTDVPRSITPLLDDFNRPDGPIGDNWRGTKFRYRILDEELHVRFLGGALYWRPDTFGPDQEASITLSHIGRRADHGVLLKVQRWGYWQGGIKVFYDSRAGEVGVDTIVPGVGKTILATWPMTLSAGDRLGGRALSDGTVQVYVNEVLIGAVDAGPFFVDEGGAIGLWFWSPREPHAISDDFGGGNLP